MGNIKLVGLDDLPLVKEGDDLAKLIVDSIIKHKIELRSHDIIAVAQKLCQDRTVTL